MEFFTAVFRILGIITIVFFVAEVIKKIWRGVFPAHKH